MIHDQDAEFHPGPYDEPTWAETNYFGFYLKGERPTNIGVYGLFRPNMGVVNTTISFNSAHTDTPWGADYWDTQVHVPMPASKSLLDYELANGLRVVCEEPNRVWTVGFDDGEGTSIDVRYTALTPAFDINDPDMDPMLRAKAEGSDFNWGTAYNGHFDQSGHYTGHVVLRGERHEVDCVSTMDHSWGPRPERGQNNMRWLHAHHDDGTVLHAIMDWDPERPDDTSALRLTHGYVRHADGTFLGCRYALRAMRASGTGSIINISSLAAVFGLPYGLDYVASKAAVISFSAFAKAWASRNPQSLAKLLATSAVISYSIFPRSYICSVPWVVR